MDVYKLFFKKLKIQIVSNSNFMNGVDTVYPHKDRSCILLKIMKLDSQKLGYHHIHYTY